MRKKTRNGRRRSPSRPLSLAPYAFFTLRNALDRRRIDKAPAARARAYILSAVVSPVLKQIGLALRTLNPEEVRALADRPLTFGVLAADETAAADIHDFLVPRDLPPAETAAAAACILRVAAEEDFARTAVGFSEPGVPHPAHYYAFDALNPAAAVRALLDDHEDDQLAIGRRFPGFRGAVSERLIWKVAKENTMFTAATSLPNVVPSLISLPWAVGEFASDTAFLTMNQVRMALLLAAAHDREIGYGEQVAEIGSIVAAAFGWRALARQAVSKVPGGGGLISKGLIAFAGTYAVGRGLEQWFRRGRRLTRAERNAFYRDAYRNGRAVVEEIVKRAAGRAAIAPGSA